MGDPTDSETFTEIETHDRYLSTVLLETNPDRICSVAWAVSHRLAELRKIRAADRRIRWSREAELSDVGEIPADNEYRPRLYCTSGTFDLAAIFATSSIETSAWLQHEDLLVAGHDVNLAVLPTGAALGLEGKDFNASFLATFGKDKAHGLPPVVGAEEEVVAALPADLAFATILKLKLNPLVCWSSAAEPDSRTVLDLAGRLGRCIERWLGTGAASPPPSPPGASGKHAALALAFGWNEVLVVAHSAHPQELVELGLQLRQEHKQISEADPSADPPREAERAHLAITSLTCLGHDASLRTRGLEWLQENVPALVPEERAEELRRWSAEKLLEGASQITDALVATLGGEVAPFDSKSNPDSHLIVQLGCHVYPGHERQLLELLESLGEGPDKAWKDGATVRVDLGKRDLWIPALPFHDFESALHSAVLLDLTQLWLRTGGEWPLFAIRPNGGDSPPACPIWAVDFEVEFPAAFDFFTRVSWSQAWPPKAGHDNESSSVEATDVSGNSLSSFSPFEKIPAGHVRGLPRSFLAPGLRKAMESERVVERVRRAMRTLQVPYPLAEQVLNVINVFQWANNREVIWDESIEMLPPILAFADWIERREAWWLRESREYRLLEERLYRYPEERKALIPRLQDIQDELFAIPNDELPELLQSFRAFFYTTQFSNYLMGEMPDINLRFKGSLHQLMRMSNMIFDSLVEFLLGPRACLAIISDTIAPRVWMQAGVAVVELSSAMFTLPFMLESLAHEVSELLLRELAKAHRFRPDTWNLEANRQEVEGSAPETRGIKDSPWLDFPIRLRGDHDDLLHELFFDLDAHFDGALSAPNPAPEWERFFESTADFMEHRLLGYSFDQWSWSFLLRTTLASTANEIHPSAAPEGSRDAPAASSGMIKTSLIRVAAVRVMLSMVETVVPTKSSKKPVEDLPLVVNLKSWKKKLLAELVKDLQPHLSRSVLGPWQDLWSESSWENALQREVLDSFPWLSNFRAFELAALFFAELDRRLQPDDEPKESDPRSRGTAQLWPEIRQGFEDFWMRPPGTGAAPGASDGAGDSAVTEASSLSSVLPHFQFVQQWMNGRERQEARNRAHEAQASPPESFEEATGAWRVWLPPDQREEAEDARGEEGDSLQRVDVTIFHRGAVVPLHAPGQAIWDKSIRRLLINLTALNPRWHHSVLERLHSSLGVQARDGREGRRDDQDF